MEFFPSALSKNLSFTEHSVVNRDVAENEVVMEEVTSHLQEQEAMEYTVEIVVCFINLSIYLM